MPKQIKQRAPDPGEGSLLNITQPGGYIFGPGYTQFGSQGASSGGGGGGSIPLHSPSSTAPSAAGATVAKSSVMDKILEFAIGPLLGGLGAGLGQPSSQQYQSFTGSRTDPRDMMSQGRDLISRLADMGFANANRPVNLPSSYAQPLPSFSGGGLPMTIGASGRDPALNNPSLLHLGNNGPGADVMSAFELLGFKPNKGKSLLG